MTDQELLNKYNIPVPRYTSYPTVPYWHDEINKLEWKENFIEQFSILNQKEGISLYLHLPFCESLCTYCGCNKKITTNHSVEDDYISAVLKEWKIYRDMMDTAPVIRQFHIGGGTPTFFSPSNLKRLITGILESTIMSYNAEFSIEGHPNNTTEEHLEVLYDLTFRRISYGVQDFDPVVQFIINRIQPYETVASATAAARKLGYSSVNFDLIYGLPKQNLTSLQNTIEQVISLKPDRIAFYSYAHVPWTSKGQRLFDENDLPNAEEKMQLYQLGKQLLTDGGYYDIGMDHFALPGDDLYKAWTNGLLHRNFMGYTTQKSTMLLGLGVSSISDTGNAFAQNAKTIHDYYDQVGKGELAVKRGYFLSDTDKAFRKYILHIICNGYTDFDPEDMPQLEAYTFPQLLQLEEDGLIEWNYSGLKVTTKGRNFIRNICAAFDLYLSGSKDISKQQFSKAI